MLHFVVMMPRVQRVEIGDTISAQNDGFTVNDELLVSVLWCGFLDPRVAAGPIVTVPGKQPDPIPIACYDETVSVIFHFMEPRIAYRDSLAGRWDAGRERV
jgi:hypothetical protein